MLGLPEFKGLFPIQLFVSLRWKVFCHLSLLIVALTAAFGLLHYFHLCQQFDAQLKARLITIEQELQGLLQRTTDRWQRLGSAVVMGIDLPSASSGFSLPSKEHLARLTALSYELDFKRIELFDRNGQLVWQWPDQAMATAIPQVAKAVEREIPLSLLSCHQECELRTFVPILAGGQNAGVLGITQAIADLILDFRAVTGKNIDLGIFIYDLTRLDALWRRPAALTNQQALIPFLSYLAKRHPDPDQLGNVVFVRWQQSTYAVYRIPLWQLIEAPKGWIVLFADVSEAVAKIRQATISVLLEAGSLAAVGELSLLLLIRTPTRRLKRLADTLPLLARGKYQAARAALAAKPRKIKLDDEIDRLESTATTLSHQLESQAEALAQRNRELAAERDFICGLLNTAHVLILTQTKTGIIQTINEHAAQLTGFSSAELSGRPFTSLLHYPQTAVDFLSWLSQPVQPSTLRFQHQVAVRCRDGTLRDIVWVHTRLRETYSHIAVLSVGLDVTDRVRAEARLAWLANHDPPTGLFNRHRFQEELERTLAELSRTQRSAAKVRPRIEPTLARDSFPLCR